MHCGFREGNEYIIFKTKLKMQPHFGFLGKCKKQISRMTWANLMIGTY